MTTLFIDLDGVLADFDRAFPKVFGRNHKEMPDEEMWELINSHPSYFLDLEPMPGALVFWHTIEYFCNPIILTACPKTNYAPAAIQKRAWCRQHLSDSVLILPVLGGKNKPLFMHHPGDILIDDWKENVEAWEAGGGRAIHHKDFETTLDLLFSME